MDEMKIEAPVPAHHPMMQAWEAYQLTDDYANTWRWAAKDEQHVEGALWAAFVRGWNAARTSARNG